MARPAGEIRQVFLATATKLFDAQGAFTHRDVAVRAQIGFEAARRTAENCVRAGVLVPVGSTKAAGSSAWMALYEPAEPMEPYPDTGPDLDGVLRGWAGFR